MAVIRNSVVAVSVLAAPAAFAPPPFHTTPGSQDKIIAERRTYSQLGTAGKRLFRQNCKTCHGAAGFGSSSGPNLHSPAYPLRRLSGAQFHATLTRDAEVTATSGPVHAFADLSFNEIELIGRFIRETRKSPLIR